MYRSVVCDGRVIKQKLNLIKFPSSTMTETGGLRVSLRLPS